MYESLKLSMESWNESTSDRDKLQHLYITTAIVLLVVAGVLGLLNQNLGQQILAIAIAAAGVFLVNAIAWALLQSFILFRLENRSTEDLSTEVAPRKPRKIARK